MLKKLSVLLLLALGCSGFIHAQITQGSIKYELRMDMHRNIPADRQEMKAMIPQFRTENFILVFNQDERFYKPEEDVNAMVMSGPGGGRQMSFRSPRIEIYTNNATGEWLSNQELMGKNYLLWDTLSLAPWRLGNEFIDIAGYRCQMAWFKDTITNEEITAWFTFSIQPFIGPDRFASLPGTILALDINNGERVWVARKIEERPLTRDEIKKPTRGERVHREEFRKMMQEQMERMRAGGGMRF